MGAIRGLLLVLIATLLFFSIFLSSLFWVLSSSLTYDNVQRESTAIGKELLTTLNITSEIKLIYPLIQLYCQNNSNYVFNAEGYTFDISCASVANGEDAVVEEGIKDFISNIYYTTYNCNFLDCASKSPVPLFLVSEKAYNY
jgi:hypothetical protein